MISRIKKGLEVRLLQDSNYLKRRFKKKTGRTLNLKNPKSFSEKIQWYKIYYKNPLLKTLADKAEVKEYVAKKIGSEYVIPTHSLFENYEDIKVKNIPQFYILKTTNGSGKNLICAKGDCFSEEYIQGYFKKWLKKSYYLHSKEWAYKDIKPCVICEELIFDEEGNLPKDYKFFCFNGTVRFIQVDHGRFTHHTRSIYDQDWNKLDFSIEEPMHKTKIAEPKNFHKMKEIAETISKELPFARIDLYNIDGRVLFGEATFYPGAGLQKFSDYNWDLKFGELIRLPK